MSRASFIFYDNGDVGLDVVPSVYNTGTLSRVLSPTGEPYIIRRQIGFDLRPKEERLEGNTKKLDGVGYLGGKRSTGVL